MKFYFVPFCIMICVSPFHVLQAKDKKPNVWVNSETVQPVCWYQDKKYSEGAILQVAETSLVCALKDKNQPNGQLGWFKLDDKGNVIYPQKTSKISIK